MEPKPLSLELVPFDPPEGAAPVPDAPKAAAPVPSAANTAEHKAPPGKTDPFLKEATRQYAEGHLDRPLWDRALAQANGDKAAAAKAYLHARATALRLLDRERRSERRAEAARAVRQELEDATEPEIFTAKEPGRLERVVALARSRNALIAAAVLVLLAVGGWVLVSVLTAEPASDATVTGTAPVVAPAKGPSTAPAVVPKSKGPGGTASRTGAGPELKRKIQELSDTGNWNVLVFYLVEWTRQEPANPAAWNQLRAVYVNLRQYDDALGAAKKALELLPDDPAMWRHLGEVNLDLGDLGAALRAFEQVAARDGRDVDSLRQVGILNAQLGHPQEAKLAFDRALAISPNDAAALCMRSAVAQLSVAPRDAYAAAREAKAIDSRCRGLGEPGIRR